MSIFDGNRELTPEVFRQYKFQEKEFKDGWFNTILNENLNRFIYLHITEDNGQYKVTGYLDPSFTVLKLKAQYIKDSMDLDILIHHLVKLDLAILFDYFEII